MKRNNHNTRETHGDTGKRLYNIWSTMKQRTTNPKAINYALYGGRGIAVCENWKRYEVFKKWSLEHGYNDSLSLDRIDGNKDYCPDNCRWVNMQVQQNNRCNNHVLSHQGRTMTLSMWAREIGMNPKTLSRRIVDKGWSVELALTTPIQTNKRTRGMSYGITH